MSPANETQAIYGHMSREANGIVSYVRNTYPSEKPIIPKIISNETRYCSELKTDGHARFNAN